MSEVDHDVVRAVAQNMCDDCPKWKECTNDGHEENLKQMIECINHGFKSTFDKRVTYDSTCPKCGEDVSEILGEASGCKSCGTITCPNELCNAEIVWGTEETYVLETDGRGKQ